MFGKWTRRVHFPSSLHCPSRALPWVACVTGRTQGTGGRDTRAGSPSEWLLASPALELPGGRRGRWVPPSAGGAGHSRASIRPCPGAIYI